MKIKIDDQEVAEFYEELNSNAEAIFVPIDNFKKFVSDIVGEDIIPPHKLAGEAILMSRSRLKTYVDTMPFRLSTYRLTSAEGGYLTATIEEMDQPKGDIMTRGKRLSGSFGSKQ